MGEAYAKMKDSLRSRPLLLGEGTKWGGGESVQGAEVGDGVRGGAVPEHRGVLGRGRGGCPDGDHHAHGRHLHPRLPLLLRQDGQGPAAARPRRASQHRRRRRRLGHLLRRPHLRRSVPHPPPSPAPHQQHKHIQSFHHLALVQGHCVLFASCSPLPQLSTNKLTTMVFYAYPLSWP